MVSRPPTPTSPAATAAVTAPGSSLYAGSHDEAFGATAHPAECAGRRAVVPRSAPRPPHAAGIEPARRALLCDSSILPQPLDI